MRAFALLVAFLAFAFGSPGAPAAAEFRIVSGPHFRVLCHFDNDSVAAAALETVEATWPIACALYALPDAALDPPLDVHLYRRAADYRAAARPVVGGKFDRNLAFSSWDTKSAHVALQPDVTDEALVAVGLNAQTRHNLAHEAAHLVCYRAFPGYRSHPDWCSEGAAIWVEQETLAARGWSAGIDDDPFASTDVVLARKLLAGGHLPGASRILCDEVKDLDLYDRYAVQSLLFRRLVARNDGAAFRAAFAKALRLEEGEGYAKRFLDTMLEPYGAEGLDGLSLDFEQYVRSRTPAWDELFRALGTAGAAWPQIAFPDRNAMAWRVAAPGADAFELCGEFEILPGSAQDPRMDVLLGRMPDDGYVAVGFVAGSGVDVDRFHRKDGRWEKLASVPARAVQTWRRLAFRLFVDGAKLTVRLDGREVVSLDLKDRPLTGPWGLGVRAGGAGVWRGVRVEGAKPAK